MVIKLYNKFKIDEILEYALKEDIGYEDISTNSIIRGPKKCRVKLFAKEEGVLAGSYVFERCFKLLDGDVNIDFFFSDGDRFIRGDLLAVVEGQVHSVLTGERLALNFLQRMSGIASYTNDIVRDLESSGIDILDTRKTSPGLRIFEKYAVKVGGGKNHRYNLSDMIMLKDNHIDAAGGVSQAVSMARSYSPYVKKILVETEDLDMVEEALEAGVDIIMLDNMSLDQMEEAIRLIDGRTIIECSGNMDREKVNKIKHLDIDYISSGGIGYSSGIIDLSLKELEIL